MKCELGAVWVQPFPGNGAILWAVAHSGRDSRLDHQNDSPPTMNTARKTLKRDASNFDDYVMGSVITILFASLFLALLVL